MECVVTYPNKKIDNTVWVRSGNLWLSKELGTANGIATLGSDGKVPSGQLPTSLGSSSSGMLSPVKAVIQDIDGYTVSGTVPSFISDGVTLVTGDRLLLVTYSSLPRLQGVWVYNSSGHWTRPTDFAKGSSPVSGIVVPVGNDGYNFGGTKWDFRSTGTIQVGDGNPDVSGDSTLTFEQMTYNYNRRRLPYHSSMRLWWKLDQTFTDSTTSNLNNEVTANGAHTFFPFPGSAGGHSAMSDDSSILGTGGVQASGAGTPNTVYMKTNDTSFQPSSSTSFLLNMWVQAGPYSGTGSTYYVGFQQGSTLVLRLGTSASNTKFSGQLRVNNVLYTVTSTKNLVIGERYLLGLSLSPNDNFIRITINGYEDGATATTANGTVTWAPSSGTRRWFLTNDPNSPIPSTFGHGVLEEIRVFNQYTPVDSERAEYLRGVGSPGKSKNVSIFV